MKCLHIIHKSGNNLDKCSHTNHNSGNNLGKGFYIIPNAGNNLGNLSILFTVLGITWINVPI